MQTLLCDSLGVCLLLVGPEDRKTTNPSHQHPSAHPRHGSTPRNAGEHGLCSVGPDGFPPAPENGPELKIRPGQEKG